MQSFARRLLILEPLLLAAMGIAYWFIFDVRQRWLWLVLLLIPIYLLRWVALRQLDKPTPLTLWSLALLGLATFNTALAGAVAPNAPPYTLGWVMLARTILGVGIVLYFARVAWQTRSIDGLVTGSIWLALIVGVMAIGSSQWNEKITALNSVVDALPVLREIPGAEAGFNANEIAGAVSWVLPFVLALTLYRWVNDRPQRDVATVATLLLGVALILGQSRFAIAGVIVTTAGLVWLLIPQLRWRLLATGALALLVMFQAALFFNLFTPPTSVDAATPRISSRDENSVENRLAIWESAVRMTLDHPLTGVGLNFFRYNPPRSQYPVPYYVENNLILPHAHNEWLQVATDLGIPGLIVFVSVQLSAALMLLRAWQRGTGEQRALAAALGAGLLAHCAFALGDAITLWDRFSFLYWWLLGLTTALYLIVNQPRQDFVEDVT